jgi:hypothetical protein
MDMIDNKIDDELLAKFFENNKINDIPDDGFSDRVMHNLPRHNEWLNTLWTVVCAIAILLYFIIHNGFNVLKLAILNICGDVSGAAVSFNFGDITPILIYIGIVTITIVAAYNIIMRERHIV